MKNHSRLPALLLCLLLLLSCAACSSGESEETESTTAPETTAAITEETTEEVISVVAPPETTEVPETTDPTPTETIRIIMQDGKGETILSALAEDKYKPLLDAREQALLYEHSAEIELSKAENLKSTIENLVLAGESRYDLVLTEPFIGADLLNSGLLENLSGAGIGITPESIGARRSITASLTVGGGVYLFASDALVSDISATYALKYNGAALSSDPIEKALAGEFTAELMLTYIAEAENALSVGDFSPVTLFRGAGGEIFTKNDKDIPISAVTSGTIFATAYDAAVELYSSSTEGDAIFTLQKLSPLAEGEIYLPLPKIYSTLEYSTPIDQYSLSLFAAPAGVVSGSRLNNLITALAACSNDYRTTVRGEIIEKGAKDSAKILDIITENARLDLGILLGWGDICDHIAEGFNKSTPAADLLANRMTEMRNKAAETAASILAGKLGIE